MAACGKAAMRTIALINQKGGVGKTTVALHLAAAFWQHGHNTLILDLDPQASAAEWHDARSTEMPHVESIQPARLSKVVEHAREIATAILNGVPAHGSVTDEAADMIATGLAMPVCPVRLGDRVAYSRCLITGQTAQEFEPHGKAAREIEQLHRWACEQVGMLPREPVRLSA
jgi:chromosome partitioning protein